MSSNSSTTVQSINVQPQIVSRYLTLTLGFIIFISGIVGNCLNILVFLIIGQYKHNACALYMLAGSLFDLLFLLIGLGTRILSQGFNKDATLTNPVWCKMRSGLVEIFSLCSLTCICLQSIDIFFITSRSVVMRQRSNIKLARRLLIGFIFLWTLHDIPYFIFQNLIFTNGISTCLVTNAIYKLYHTYVLFLVLSIFVPIIVSFFAFRIYKHLQLLTLRNQRFLSGIARQMTRMALFQIAVVLLFQFPYGVATAYFTGSTNLLKSLDRQFQDNVTQAFFNLYVYGLYAVSNRHYMIAVQMILCFIFIQLIYVKRIFLY
jgi:hypothetical protein